MKERHCCIYYDEKVRCQNPYYGSIRVRVVHPTFRKTWQTWHLCKAHYLLFLAKEGKGYYRWYSKTKGEKSPVIAYKKLPVLKTPVSTWKPMGPAFLTVDARCQEYPSEYTSTNFNIYINLAKVPEMPFDDLVFHINRAILTETICRYNTENGYARECSGDCVPNIIAKHFLKMLWFTASFDFYENYESYLEGIKTDEKP